MINTQKIIGLWLLSYVCLTIYFINTTPIYAHALGLSLFLFSFLDSCVLQKKAVNLNSAVFTYLLFVFWAVLSFFWAMNVDDYSEHQQRIMFCAILIVSLYNIFIWYDVASYFLWGFVFGGLMNFFLFFNLLPYAGMQVDQTTWRFSGTIGNSNGLSNIMAFSLFSSILIKNFFSYNNKFFNFLLLLNIPVSLYVIIQTGSKKGFVLGMSFLFLFFIPYIKSAKGMVYAFFISIFLFTGFNYLSEDDRFSDQLEFMSKRFESAQETIQGGDAEESTHTRLWLIENGFRLWMDNPVLGVGLNNSSHFFGKPVHNNFLETLVNFGIVGFLLYYIFYFQIVAGSLKIRNRVLKTCVLYFLFVFLIMDNTWSSYIDLFFISMITMLQAFFNNKNLAIFECDSHEKNSFS